MAQTRTGADKLAARAIGVTLREYVRHRLLAQKWCSKCGLWLATTAFNTDRSRGDSLYPICRDCQNARARNSYIPKGPTEHHGPLPGPERDGDRVQARAKVNRLVRQGRIPHPTSLPCARCGHAGRDRRHEYHHHLGYGSGHHTDVISVCTICHRVFDPVWRSRARNEKGQFYGRAN